MIVYAEEMMEEQGTLDWQRARLGKITGSKCGDLMVKGRSKEEVFGATAKDYLYQLAGERNLNPRVVESDEEFQKYLDAEVVINTKAIRIGHEREPEARRLFEKFHHKEVFEVISCPHDTIPNFAASPDGIVIVDGRPTACIEIKSTGVKHFMKYRVEVRDAEGLKKANSTYYWQIQAEMMCTGLDLTHFIVFNPDQKVPLYVVDIPRNEEDCKLLEERIRLANEYIDKMIKDYG